MRFRQLINPTYQNLYEACLTKAPFAQNEAIPSKHLFISIALSMEKISVETEPDHSYSRPWIDDPTLATAIPHVQLFFHSNSSEDLSVNMEEEKTLEKINWGPTINTILPETFEYESKSEEMPTCEQNKFLGQIRELLDETHLASLCCELVRFDKDTSGGKKRRSSIRRIRPTSSIGDYPFIILSPDYRHV